MLLYNSPDSGNCYKVRLLLGQLGIAFETRDLDVIDRSNRREVIGGLDPALRGPHLVLDDGRPLGESDAILFYLAEGTPYLPEDRYERAQVLQWMFFEQYQHEPNIAVVRFWVHLAPDRPSEEEIEAKRTAGYVSLDAMEQHLASTGFLVGGRYTIADIALYGYTHVAHEGGFELDRYPAIQAWLYRVAAQPGHVTMDT